MRSIEIRNGVDHLRKMNPLAVTLSSVSNTLPSRTDYGLMARDITEPKALFGCLLASSQSRGVVSILKNQATARSRGLR